MPFSDHRRLPATAEITGIAELPRCPGAVVEGDLASVWEAEARFEGDSLTRVPGGGLPSDAKKLGLGLPRSCHAAHESITVGRAGPIRAYRQLSFGLADDKKRQPTISSAPRVGSAGWRVAAPGRQQGSH
jgi:hypothetical protein